MRSVLLLNYRKPTHRVGRPGRCAEDAPAYTLCAVPVDLPCAVIERRPDCETQLFAGAPPSRRAGTACPSSSRSTPRKVPEVGNSMKHLAVATLRFASTRPIPRLLDTRPAASRRSDSEQSPSATRLTSRRWESWAGPRPSDTAPTQESGGNSTAIVPGIPDSGDVTATRPKTKGQAAFPQPDLMYQSELNCSWCAVRDGSSGPAAAMCVRGICPQCPENFRQSTTSTGSTWMRPE